MMQAIETTANFNEKGEIEIDNLPFLKNRKVKLLILLQEDEEKEWHQFSMKNLSDGYGDDEPDYTLNMLKEPNPDFKP